MKQTLLDWLQRFQGGQNGHLEIYLEDGKPLGQVYEEACTHIKAQEQVIEHLRGEIKALRHEVSCKDKMAQTLRDEYPQLYIRYFTKRGADDRAAGRPTKTGIKPKRRRA